jgi:hypothetical protein
MSLLERLLPTVGSRVLLRIVWAQAEALGISKRAIQRCYGRLGIFGLNDDLGAWLVRRAPVAVASEEEARKPWKRPPLS